MVAVRVDKQPAVFWAGLTRSLLAFSVSSIVLAPCQLFSYAPRVFKKGGGEHVSLGMSSASEALVP